MAALAKGHIWAPNRTMSAIFKSRIDQTSGRTCTRVKGQVQSGMNLLVRSRVGRRFIGLFLLLSLPVIAAGWFGIRRATQTIREQTHGVLRAASDGAEA